MAIARYKDLCIDTGDTEALGRFYSAALGLEFEPDGHAGALSGPEPSQRVWMNVVPETKTVKHRVHLDVNCASIDDLIALGATLVEQPAANLPWTVLADPEGGEFCAFVRDPTELAKYRLHELVVDSVEPREIAAWWADAFGVQLGGRADKDWWWISEVPGMPYGGWDFVPVPEPKTVKNRVHWDVLVESVDDLVTAGATLLRGPTEEDSWSVMADPEGNEFCAFMKRS
jgi:predicted enzyme related to lactoylglutathione lyase